LVVTAPAVSFGPATAKRIERPTAGEPSLFWTVAVSVFGSPGVRFALGGSSSSVAGTTGGGGGGGAGDACTSTAPMSQVVNPGRGRPRWSMAGQPAALPPSIAGLPAWGGKVSV
jgi:hypothetical protein